MLVAAALFSTMSVLVKLGGQRLPVQQLMFARVIVTFVLSAIALRRLGVSPLGVDRPRLLLRALSGIGGLGCFFYALTHLPLADATAIQFSNPVITALLATLFLRERLGRLEWFGVAISILGVVAVARPTAIFGASTEPLPTVALLAAIGGATLSAVSYTTVRRLRQTDHPLVVVWAFPAIGLPIIGPIALLTWVPPTPMEWLVLLGIGVTTQLAQVYMTRSLHLARAGIATAASTVQIALGFVWGVALFGESVVAIGVVGSALIIGGILVTSHPTRRLPRSSEAATPG